MHLTKQDMIDCVKEGFEDYGYKSAILKRLWIGFNTSILTYADCTALNLVVKELDNHMLDKVDFHPIMTIDNFDLCICRLLYVAGKWKELCFYQLLINDNYDLFYVNICYESETLINVIFATKDTNIGMVVDDQKVGIKMVRTINMEKEF